MTTLTGLSDQPKQQSSFVLTDGTPVSLYLEYRQQQNGWIANIAWQNFVLNGIRVVATPNLLHQWKNVIPFGISILTTGHAEPTKIDDFVNGFATVLILDSADVQDIEDTIFAGY